MHRTLSGSALAFVVGVAACVAVACGDGDGDDDGDPTPTEAAAVNDGSTLVEQSTVGNIGPYRVGVVRVDTDEGTAVVSISRANSQESAVTATLRRGEPHELEGGAIVMTDPRDGEDGKRDTVRLRFEAR